MPCSIDNPTWTTVSALGARIFVSDGDFLLRIELEDGSLDDLVLDDGVPVALQVTDGSPPALEYAVAGWKKKCKSVATATFLLDPQNTAGNFIFRKDGTGIGVSDIRDDSFRAIYINMLGFPVTIERDSDNVLLRFQNDTNHYFISPKLSTGL